MRAVGSRGSDKPRKVLPESQLLQGLPGGPAAARTLCSSRAAQPGCPLTGELRSVAAGCSGGAVGWLSHWASPPLTFRELIGLESVSL